MKKVICILTAVLLMLTAAGCGNAQTVEKATEAAAVTEVPSVTETAPVTEGNEVVITVKDYGTIELELDREAAPVTVDNFVKLVQDGFYDGLTFHRIISGFMIQGGDPQGNGTGGSEVQIKGEFRNNGVENPISHTRGVISMARARNMDSASSQFFIVHEDSTFLDGDYAGFGHVTKGMEVVDAICKDTPVLDDNGSVDRSEQPVIESIRMK